MKAPRFTISGLAIIVVVIAVNCGVLRTFFKRPSPEAELAIVGLLPMMNILALLLMPLAGEREERVRLGPFRIGFCVFGFMALSVYSAALANFSPDLYRIPFALSPGLRPGYIMGLASLAIYSGPQFAFATLGGVLNRWFPTRLVRIESTKHEQLSMRGFDQFSIAELMALVVLVAVDCAIIAAYAEREWNISPFTSDFFDLVVFCMLPMANILAIGLAPLLRIGSEGQETGGFRLGFVLGGGAALYLWLLGSLMATIEIHSTLGNLRPSFPDLWLFVSAVIALSLSSQLAIACLGGFLNRRWRFALRINRRDAPRSDVAVAL